MNKSKERALEYESSLDYYHYTSDNPSVAYEAGYEQAEQDLALTWEDVEKIIEISDELQNYADVGIIETFLESEESFYTEVLRRFNEYKII